MKLPSAEGGPVTTEVGYFQADATALAAWLLEGLGAPWALRAFSWGSMRAAVADLRPSVPLTRYAVVPVGSWSVVLSNGPLGSDVGLLPSQAARELRCRALRTVCVPDEAEFPARILELFGPSGAPPLGLERTIAAAKDGDKWVFETAGEPLPFERPGRYQRRRVSERFSVDLLAEYLESLGVPVNDEPDWAAVRLMERES